MSFRKIGYIFIRISFRKLDSFARKFRNGSSIQTSTFRGFKTRSTNFAKLEGGLREFKKPHQKQGYELKLLTAGCMAAPGVGGYFLFLANEEKVGIDDGEKIVDVEKVYDDAKEVIVDTIYVKRDFNDKNAEELVKDVENIVEDANEVVDDMTKVISDAETLAEKVTETKEIFSKIIGQTAEMFSDDVKKVVDEVYAEAKEYFVEEVKEYIIEEDKEYVIEEVNDIIETAGALNPMKYIGIATGTAIVTFAIAVAFSLGRINK